ncbi:PAS domain S-box protein [Pelotomaculum isophthalicicum JI]|uniref:histidine kinase n=1 Tax=Pelotomaculum isophthalicicum JI TaxID=947010 RepID=A0A9X4H4S7_9FIRM|nr:CHASE4 domain-containing protein [Pelotomaculum isophthalicicum]MDF9407004.1 PAS domain S-box protein [Pelotomaculum isophthalicicum JI]
MTLRKKTIIIFGITLICLIIILFIISKCILSASFANLEKQSITVNVERARDALLNNIDTLNRQAGDWAQWNDTYEFVNDLNEEYIKMNLTNNTFIALKLNLILYINSSGRIVYGKGFDLENENETPVPDSLVDHLNNYDFLFNNKNQKDGAAGIILLPEGPMLIASWPILTSERSGPARGVLIMGRYLDSSEINRLSETAHLSLAVCQFNDVRIFPDIQTASSFLSEESPAFVQPVSPDSIAGYALLNDIYGSPALILRTDMSREIYKQGRTSMQYLILSLLLIGLVFGVVTLLLLEKVVLCRLARLSANVLDISTSGDLACRVSMTGGDELSTLAGQINQMLSSLERSQYKLQESEDNYRTIFENTGTAILIIGEKKVISLVNTEFEKLSGYTKEEVENKKKITDFVAKDDLDRINDYYNRRVYKNIAPRNYEFQFFDKQENIKDIYTTVAVIPRTNKIVVALLDITDRKRVEERYRNLAKKLRNLAKRLREVDLYQSEERFQKIFHNSPDLIAILRAEDNRFVEVNQRFLDVVEYSREEVLGHKPEDLDFLSGQDNVIESAIIEFKEKGELQNFDLKVKTKSGKTVNLLLSAERINLNGENCRIVMMKDITKEKKMEAEMARLDRLNLIGEMAAGIGHEVRNPMTTVRGFLQLLDRKIEYDKHKEYFNLMISELDRANSIITEFLSMAKDKPVDLKSQNLNQLLQTLFPLIQADAMNSDKYIEMELAEIPDLLLDEKEVRQLILNLVHNGYQAMSNGKTLKIKTYTEDGEVVLAVEDQGCGIPNDIADKIGTPFFTTKDHGTGLGLSVCYSIVARHNAKIFFKTSSTGTTFFVRFDPALSPLQK